MDRSEVEDAQDEQRRRNEGISRGSPTYVHPAVESAEAQRVQQCKEKGCSFTVSWRGPMRPEVRSELAKHAEAHRVEAERLRIEALPIYTYPCKLCGEKVSFHGKIGEYQNAKFREQIMWHKAEHEIESELVSE